MSASSPEPTEPYAVVYSRQARRNLHEYLPFEVAVAAVETIKEPLATNPHRVGKPLKEPYDTSRTVPWEPGGEIPPGDPTTSHHKRSWRATSSVAGQDTLITTGRSN